MVKAGVEGSGYAEASGVGEDGDAGVGGVVGEDAGGGVGGGVVDEEEVEGGEGLSEDGADGGVECVGRGSAAIVDGEEDGHKRGRCGGWRR